MRSSTNNASSRHVLHCDVFSCQESHVLLQRSAASATVDEWTLALTLDQTSVGKDFKMMRNGR
jgi:hypothetical protein